MGRQALIWAWIVVGCMASTACSRRALGVLFDLPPAEETAAPPGTAAALPPDISPELLSSEFLLDPTDTITPEIEKTLDPDSVVAMLPRDHAGNIDWMAAIRQEIIRPRHGINGPRSTRPGSFEFKFDFYFPGPTEMFDAFFPHSSHTQWLDCAQCHPRIFRTRDTPIKMADIFAGKYCGECHGKVAYPVMTGCERCHTGMQQPPNRAKPELLGTVTMRRATEILAERARDSLVVLDSAGAVALAEGNAAGVNTDDFPRARFPHWVHRIRFRCKTCHMEIFEPKAGENVVTMADIANGEKCGRCHNGQVAFQPGIENCERCHVDPKAGTTQPGAAGPDEHGGGPAP
ncbi:MAG: c(7)-type cytochrome triheme domain-containing protein [Gemmatimonadota bacterium]